MPTTVDQIIADVEDQPDTRRAVARLIDHLAGALREATDSDGDDLAMEVLDRTEDLTDAVLRIAERPTGTAQDQSSGEATPAPGATGYAQADAALGIEPESGSTTPGPGEQGYGGDAPVGRDDDEEQRRGPA